MKRRRAGLIVLVFAALTGVVAAQPAAPRSAQDAKIASLIRVMTTEGPEKRAAAAAALGRIGRPAVKPLMTALPHDDEAVRTDLAKALARVGPAAVDLLIPGIMDKDIHIRWGSAVALGDIGDVRAVDPLIAGLRDRTWASRMCTALALGRIGDRRAVPPLIEAVNDTTWPHRFAAVQALGQLGDARAVKPLVTLLNDGALRAEASQALAKLGKVAVPPLLDALRGENEALQQVAADALSTIKDPQAVEAVAKYRRDARARARALEIKTSGAVLDAWGFWRSFITLRQPVVRRGRALAKVPIGAKWLECETATAPVDWTAPDFDDSAWPRHAGVITPLQRNKVDGSALVAQSCLRGKFGVTDPSAVRGLCVSVSYHGGVVLTLNGHVFARGHLVRDDGPSDDAPGETFAEDYPPEASTQPELRVRTLSEVPVPAALLRKGVNVLGIEVHRAPFNEKDVGKDRRGRMVIIGWGTCELCNVKMWASSLDGLVPNVVRPEGVQVWNSSPLDPDFDMDYGDPGEPVRPIRLVGTPGGAFSGKVVVGSTEPLKGVHAFTTGLSRTDGAGFIGPASVQVRYAGASGVDHAAWLRYPVAATRFDALHETPPTVVPVRESRPHWRSRRVPGQPTPVFGAVQPVWITVRVPATAQPGDYRGTLVVLVEGRQRVRVPVELHLCAWRLPPPSDYHTFIEFIQSPDTLALEYDVPMWSPRHFALVERSLRLLGDVGSRSVYLPLICETNLGNAQSIVRWIRRPDGGYTYDLSILERYLQLAKTHLRKPRVVCLAVWDTYLEGGRYTGSPKYTPKRVSEDRKTHEGLGPAVSRLDPATGKVERLVLPQYSDAGSRALWQPLMRQVCARLKALDLADAAMLGLVTDTTPTKEVVTLFKDLCPGTPWLRQSHGLGKALHGVPYGYSATVWGAHFLRDPVDARTFGWKRPELVVQFPRSHMDGFTMTTQRLMAEINIASQQRGFGRLGGDFWTVLRNKRGQRIGRVSGGRYPKTSWRALNIVSSYLAPAPDGPVATARLEMVREGVQECEARIFIEKALTDPERRARLPEALAARCQRVLDARTRALLRGTSSLAISGSYNATSSSGWWGRPGVLGEQWFIASGWQERTRKLFDAAAEVDAALKHP